MAKGICSIEDCDKPVRTVGWCNMHYLRWWRTGDVRWQPMTWEQRFWLYVAKDGPDGCWVWTGTMDGRGYGRIKPAGRSGKSVGTHRWAYERLVGPIPDGHHVLHRCDNRPCCNPQHLFTGTDADNVADMDSKARRVTSVTADQVREIRRRYAIHRTPQHVLGAEYGIGQAQVSKIIRRESWMHVID